MLLGTVYDCSSFLQGRIFEGKEPPQFVALFQPMVVLKVSYAKSDAILLTYIDFVKLTSPTELCLFQGGLSSGYKKLLADKGLQDETYSTETIALIRISGTSIHNNKAVQVDAVCVY